MNKKLIALVGASVLTIAMGTTAFAANTANEVKNTISTTAQVQQDNSYGCGGRMSGYGFMMDEDGNLLERSEFESKLDKGIKDGNIQSEDRDFYLRMYESCTSSDTTNTRGNGRMGGCGR